jgi:hypothetical protein
MNDIIRIHEIDETIKMLWEFIDGKAWVYWRQGVP